MIIIKKAIILVSILLVCCVLLGCRTLPPIAGFTATPTGGQVPVEVQFTDESLGNIETWQWDFNSDGVIDSLSQNPRFTYTKAGIYTVSLTASNSDGQDTDTKLDYLRFTIHPCFIDFMAEPTRVEGLKEIQFTDLSRGKVTSRAWDFNNDGVTDSTEQNPTYTYKRDGDYSVTLNITGPDYELSLTKVNYIHVRGCPT